MEICYNTKPFWKEDPELVFSALNSLDMHNLELHLGNFLIHTWNIGEVKKLIKKYNMHIPIVDGGWYDFLHFNDLDQNEVTLENQINLAKEFNAPCLRLFLTQATTRQIWERSTEELSASIDELIDMSNGIHILFETHDGVTLKARWMKKFFNDAYYYRKRLHEKMSHGALLDISGLLTPGIVYDPMNMVRGMEDVDEGYDILEPLIKHIHIKGGMLENGFGSLGEGDYTQLTLNFLKKISKAGYKGFLGIEYEGVNNPFLGLLKSRNYLLWANGQF